DSAASIPPAVLARRAAAVGIPAEPLDDVAEAIDRAVAQAASPPAVVICGSLYLAGQVLRQWPAS
ncbi:MAG: bifunctional folylpolyglutamate synthase/dihydrofolate synthase, partial [Pseudomonadota bacterium]